MRIAKITNITFGPEMSRVSVQWVDAKDRTGYTIGSADNEHIKALMARWLRENPAPHPAFHINGG